MRVHLLLALAVVAALTGAARAQVEVGVQLSTEGEALAARLGITAAELAQRMEDNINTAYGLMDVDAFLRSFADATAFSMRGLGVDYASDPDSLVVGVGANVAIAASEQVNAVERPTQGLAPNVALMAGLNLSSYGLPRWTLLANGFYRRGSTESLRGGIASAGAHAQIRLANPQYEGGPARLLRWIGIDLTFGFEYTRWSLGVDDSITTNFGVSGTMGNATLIVDSTGRFDLTSEALTLPVEVSTGVRVAMLLSVYVGAGLDLSAGSGGLDANLTGVLLSDIGRQVGTTTISGGGDSRASPVSARILAGAQLNLWKLRIYGQVMGATPSAACVGFGFRGVL